MNIVEAAEAFGKPVSHIEAVALGRMMDGKPTLRGSSDPLFRGDPALHNPEDLLVAALSSCHMLSYLAHAARAGLHVLAYEDDATGTMTFAGGGGRFTDVLLRPRVTIAAGADAALAEALHGRAHDDCFIAASCNFPVRHEATIERGSGHVPAGTSPVLR